MQTYVHKRICAYLNTVGDEGHGAAENSLDLDGKIRLETFIRLRDEKYAFIREVRNIHLFERFEHKFAREVSNIRLFERLATYIHDACLLSLSVYTYIHTYMHACIHTYLSFIHTGQKHVFTMHAS